MEVLNLMKLKNLREIFLTNIVDEEIIEIIDFLGPHKVMVSHLSSEDGKENTNRSLIKKNLPFSQLGPAIYQDWYFIQGPF